MRGRQGFVEGRLTQDRWKSPADGKGMSRVRVTAEQVTFLGGRPEAAPGIGPMTIIAGEDGTNAAGKVTATVSAVAGTTAATPTAGEKMQAQVGKKVDLVTGKVVGTVEPIMDKRESDVPDAGDLFGGLE